MRIQRRRLQTTLLFATLMLCFACGNRQSPEPQRAEEEEQPPAEPSEEVTPTPETTPPPAQDTSSSGSIQEVCGNEAEQARMAQIPDERIPLASNGQRLRCIEGVTWRVVTFEAGGHRYDLYAYENHRPSWADGPVLYGSLLVVDGTAREEAMTTDLSSQFSFWRGLGPFSDLDEGNARGLLLAVVLSSGGFNASIEERALQAALTHWPEATAYVQQRAPGLRHDAQGWALRAYSPSSTGGRGGTCYHLTQFALAIDGAGHISGNRNRWSTGNHVGGPCGTPIPTPAGSAPTATP